MRETIDFSTVVVKLRNMRDLCQISGRIFPCSVRCWIRYRDSFDRYSKSTC